MDIFNVLMPNQPSQTTEQTNAKNAPLKSFMQNLIEQGKEDFSTFNLAPMRKTISKPKLKKNMEFHIKRIYSDHDNMDFFYDIKYALHKKLDMTKVEVYADGRTYNMLEYLMYAYQKNPKQHLLFSKYLIVNEPKFLTQETIDNCLNLLLKEDIYKSREILLECDNEFLKTYKFLIDHGAKSINISSALFDSRGELYNYNVNLIELLLYENHPEITQKVVNSFYTCPNPKNFYPILQRYNLSLNFDDALAKLIYQDGEHVMNYLVENGVYKRQDITEERVKFALAKKGINNPDVIKRAVDRAKLINAGLSKAQSQQDKQKVSTKQTLKATQEIDKIFEDAVKSVEASK